ncbi:MAG: hypothetical protein Q7R88_01605 [bacterium]|nr:hypothetical protein [bacterium]
MIINNLHKNLLIVIILILLLGGSAPILMAATSWQPLIDESGLELGIKADQLNSLPIEKQQELETKLRLIGAGKNWEGGDFEKGAQAFGKIVAMSPSSPSIKGIDFLKLALVGTGIKIILEAPKITLVHFYVANRKQGIADTIAWQKAVEPSVTSCQEWGIAQLNETFPVCPLLKDKEKLEALHQSAQFIWAGVELYQEYQDPEQLKVLRQWILSDIEAGQKLQQTTGFFSSLWQAITHSVKIAYVSVKDFFTATTLQKDESAVKPSELSGQISNALSSGADKKIPALSQQNNSSNKPKSQSVQQSSPTATKERTVNLRYKTGCDKNLGSPVPFVALDWSVNYENMTSQTIYRNNEVILNAPPSVGPSYFDGTIKAGRTYNYVIKAEYKDGYSNSAEANVVVPINICGSINSVQNESVSSGPALPATPPPSSSGGGGGFGYLPTLVPQSVQEQPTPTPSAAQAQSQTQQGEIITVRVKEIGCDKNTVDVPPPNFKYSKFSVNVKWDKVNPFINLEWGSVGMSKNSGTRYKIYRNGELITPMASYNASFGDGSVTTGTTYAYVVRSEYTDGSVQVSQPLTITVPKDVCGAVPYVDLKVNDSDDRVIASPLSTKFDIKLTTFVGSDKEGYASCLAFREYDTSARWGQIVEGNDIYYFFDSTTTEDNGPFLHRDFFSIVCPTKEESKHFFESVGGFFVYLSELSSQKISLVSAMRLLVSGLNLEERSQTGNFFGAWGDKTITHEVPQSYVAEMLRGFKPRADAVEVFFSPLDTESGYKASVVKSMRSCETSIKRGNFLKLEVLYDGELEYRDTAVLMLSADAHLDNSDLILNLLLNPSYLSYICGKSYSEDMHMSHYIPDTVPPGNYFIGLLFKDGRQITAPLMVE